MRLFDKVTKNIIACKLRELPTKLNYKVQLWLYVLYCNVDESNEVETTDDFRKRTGEKRQDSDLASTRSPTNYREELSSDTTAAGLKNETYLVASDR